MLILFQLIFVCCSLAALVSVFRRHKAGQLGPKGTLFWILFWCLVIVAVIWPRSTAALASLFGIGRGADFVIYSAIVVLFYLVFQLHIKIESLARQLTVLVRNQAIETHRKKKT